MEAEAIRAAQSLNTQEVSAPETAKPRIEAAKDETSPGNVEAAGKTSRLPPKPVGKLANGGERLDLIGVKIAALRAVDPGPRSLSIRVAAAKTGKKSSPRRLRSIATSQRTGRSTPAGNRSRIRIWPTGQLIAAWSRVRRRISPRLVAKVGGGPGHDPFSIEAIRRRGERPDHASGEILPLARAAM